jgi:hypothetical protein
MAGGVLQICGLLALLIAACELVTRIFPRRLRDEMQEIFGDVPSSPRPEPELERLRQRGAL